MNGPLSRPLTLALLLTPVAAQATNGMNPVSFGARAAGMAGADTAVATDANAMNTNPAGITQFEHRADLGVSLLMPTLTLNDRVATPQGVMTLNDGLEGESKLFPLITASYAQRVWQGLHAGLGFYVQGGMGAEFQDAKTFVDDDPTTPLTTQPTPATYDLSSEISYFKLTPSLAYEFGDLTPGMKLSLGVALNVGLAKLQFSHAGFQFPEPDGDGVYQAHEVTFESDYATGFAVRAGVLASFCDERLSVGASYQSKATLDFEGPVEVDSMMKYDATSEFGWPQEVAFGVAVRPIDTLLFSTEVRWVDWSDTMDVVTFEGSAQGQVPPGYEKLTMPFKMKWDDQIVIAAGAEYEVMADRLWLRAGYNHATSPVDGEGINPLFPAVTENHVNGGLGVMIVPGLVVDAAIEYAFENEVESNADNQMAVQPGTTTPNGYSFGVAMSQVTAHLGVGYEF